MKIIFGVYEITDGVLLTDNENVYSYDDDDITINICGYLYCGKENKSSDGISVKRLFNEHNRRITEYLNGVYILVIHDKKTKNLYIFHDQNTSALTLYYTILETKVFYSTSIKKLLKESGIKRSLNNETVSDFIVNGFINGSQTLINNIFKIKINHALQASQQKWNKSKFNIEAQFIICSCIRQYRAGYGIFPDSQDHIPRQRCSA
jgi:asparagine synthetase B (glutamine-hydrolysing)